MTYFDDLHKKFRREYPKHSDDKIKKAIANVIEKYDIYYLVEKELQSSEETSKFYIESDVKCEKQRERHTGVLCDELEEFHGTLPYEDSEKVRKWVTQLREGSNIKRDALMSLGVYIDRKEKEDDRTMEKLERWGEYSND